MDKFMALRVFARVVEHGGFTAAAKRIGQSGQFFELLRDLASDADAARRDH